MKVRISEASGRVLDLLVAMAGGGKDAQAWYANPAALESYSTDPAAGAPVLDEERIGTVAMEGVRDGVRRQWWIAGKTINDLRDHPSEGADRLEAGLRCFVAGELGGEVEVPEDLIAKLVASRAAQPAPPVRPGVSSTASPVLSAIDAYLEFGESTVGTAHQGYFSGAGWAAQCLRYHRDELLVEGAVERARRSLAEQLPRDVASLAATPWPYRNVGKGTFARIWWCYVELTKTALGLLSDKERATLADQLDPRWYSHACDVEMGDEQFISGLAQKVASAYFESPESESRVPRPFVDWLLEQTATTPVRETPRG